MSHPPGVLALFAVALAAVAGTPLAAVLVLAGWVAFLVLGAIRYRRARRRQ